MGVDTSHPAAPPGSEGDGSGAVVGAALLAAAAISAYVLRVGGACCGGVIARDLYDYATWLLVGGLAAAGVTLLVGRTARVRVLAAGAGGVLACQLAGTGVVAVRRWVPVGGFGLGTWDNVGQLRAVSALLALCGIAATASSLVSLNRDHALPARVTVPRRVVAVLAGLVVLAGLPIVVAGGEAEALDATSIGAHALIYSLPLGASLALTGWLTRPAALAVVVTVMLSGLALAKPIRQLVSTPAPTAGLLLVVAAGCVVLVSRWASASKEPIPD